jgi:hypothetical protein
MGAEVRYVLINLASPGISFAAPILMELQMNKISKFLVVILIQSCAATAFAQDLATREEVVTCGALQAKATEYRKWSAALEDLTELEGLKPAVMNKFSKLLLKKIYEDINEVQDLAGISEELTVVVQAEKLLKRVKSIETEEANELMMEKLSQLDRAMFDTLEEARQSITDCRISKGTSGKKSQKSSPTKESSETESPSALVQ